MEVAFPGLQTADSQLYGQIILIIGIRCGVQHDFIDAVCGFRGNGCLKCRNGVGGVSGRVDFGDFVAAAFEVTAEIFGHGHYGQCHIRTGGAGSGQMQVETERISCSYVDSRIVSVKVKAFRCVGRQSEQAQTGKNNQQNCNDSH